MKKKVIKPFNINEYLDINNNCKVETRCGYPVTTLMPDTICIGGDRNVNGMTDFPIMAELGTPIGMRIAFYTKEGTFYRVGESDLDLVLVEEQEIPSITKEEIKDHLQWFVDNADCLIEGLGAKVHEKLLGMVLAMHIAYRNRDNGIIPDLAKEEAQPTKEDAQDENVKYCALKLEGLEEIPNEEFAKRYVKFAVSCVNDALGYSAKKRNAFGWQKVWDDQGYFGVIEETKAKKIIEKYPEFPFRLYYKSNITSDDHGEA